MKQKALVICPGRGTYNKEELGYFQCYHSDKKDLMKTIDAYRESQGQVAISALDNSDKFSTDEHTRGDNASALIYGCAYADFQSIDRNKYDIRAVTGNSMGWYIALACANAVSFNGGLEIINTMGTLMQEALIGGQLIYSYVDSNWKIIDGALEYILALISEIDGLHASINLGGMFVFGGTEEALQKLETQLEPREQFPFRLKNHAAFHTPLQNPISEKALKHFDLNLFQNSNVPLIDGRGHAWVPHTISSQEIFNYTFGHQVVKPYDFTHSVQCSVKEYAPDKIIILGPGKTLGGAVAQSLIEAKWQGLDSKESFINAQKSDPFVLSMGIDEQRKVVV